MPRSGRVRVPRPGPWAPTPPRRVAPGAGRRWAPRRTVPTRAGPPGRVGSRGHVPRDRKRGWGSQPQESFHLIGWVRFWYGGLGEIGQELLQLRGLIGAPSQEFVFAGAVGDVHRRVDPLGDGLGGGGQLLALAQNLAGAAAGDGSPSPTTLFVPQDGDVVLVQL